MLELKIFTFWVLKNLSQFLSWFNSKIKKKFDTIFYGKHQRKFYPNEIEDLVFKCNSIDYINNRFENEIKTDVIELNNIRLASGLQKINSFINWEKSYIDPEDIESLHRWNWYLFEASNNKLEIKKLNWGLRQIEKWIDLYGNELEYPIKKLNHFPRWESYTISERISNYLLIKKIFNLSSKKADQSVFYQTKLLINKLEYFDDLTGNHIINNARAILIAGISFNILEWKKLSKKILEIELSKLIYKDGFLREGSSHYQLLFTRWVYEMTFFSKDSDDKKLINFLEFYLKKLYDKCKFFKIIQNQKIEIPLFGDVSPDFGPEWLFGLYELSTKDKKSQALNNGYSWLNLLSSSRFKIDNNLDSSLYQKNGKYIFPNSGWYRFNLNNSSIFIHSEPKGVSRHVGHHHNDNGHFCYYYKNIPIIIDQGRLNYMNNFFTLPRAHNSLTVNGLGVVPNNFNRFPKDYSQCENSIKSNNLNKEFKITYLTSGFSRIKKNLLWERGFRIFQKGLTIKDKLSTTYNLSVKTYFHFDFRIKVKIIGDDIFLTGSGLTGKMSISSKSDYSLKIHNNNKLGLGVQSHSYGKENATSTLEIFRDKKLNNDICYTIDWEN